VKELLISRSSSYFGARMSTVNINKVVGCMFAMPIPTPDGEFVAYYSASGLCRLHFPAKVRKRWNKTAAARPPTSVQRWHAAATKALNRVLGGRPPINLPPLDLSGGTVFQQHVWGALRRITWGRTKSYGEVAEAIGNAKAVRAVGSACGANPIPVFVPCHRVLAANQGLGGFSGGLAWKRRLLAPEQNKKRGSL
jgi:methylated-DNA-[protein]-cysteine S-methyltransferase